ncbi:MAG TPA: hypothetical protein VFZ66_13995, partial [Herpetosiphonaceae bacterium]
RDAAAIMSLYPTTRSELLSFARARQPCRPSGRSRRGLETQTQSRQQLHPRAVFYELQTQQGAPMH